MSAIDHRGNRLFIVLAGFFLTNAIIAEFVGVKIFSLEATLGAHPFHWSLLGIEGTLNFTTGVLLWPFIFILTDTINEYFGVRGVRFISWVAVGFIVYAFVAAYVSIVVAPADFWVSSNAALGVPDVQKAYALIFGQGLWTIGGSVIAFLLGQLVDVAIFHRIRRATGEKWVWLRATGSTAVSQILRQFRGALYRVRDRAAEVAGLAVPRRGHRELSLQDGGGDRAHSAVVCHAPADRALPRHGHGRGHAGRRGTLSAPGRVRNGMNGKHGAALRA